MVTTTDVILDVHCPANVYETLRAAGFNKDMLRQEALEALAARLYAEHRLSLGKAAELARLPIVRFMDLLRSLHMTIVDYGEEEYDQDLYTIAHLTQPVQETPS